MSNLKRLSLTTVGGLCLLASLWSCSAMNIDTAGPVKAQNPETQRQASSSRSYQPAQPGLLAAQSRPAGTPARTPVLDNDMDLEPELSAVPLTPGQTGTLLEPEVTGPLPQKTPQLTDDQRRILSQKSGLDFDLDLFDSQEVERYFAYYTGPARDTFARWLKRSEAYLPAVRESLLRNGLPQDLAMLPFAESGYNCNAYSWAGAGGMWQFMPYTGRKYGLTVDWWIDERRDPRLSTEAAAKYLSFLNDMFGDWYLALAAYNAGEGKISRALEMTNAEDFLDLVSQNDRLNRTMRLKTETQHYVPKFIAITKIFQNLEALGFEPVNWDAAPKLETVQVPGGTDLLALAKAGGMNWEEFHALNPAFRRQVSPPDRNVAVSIPKDKIQPMLAYLQNPSILPHAGFIAHNMQKGESLRSLAKRYRVPQEVISQVNGPAAQAMKPGTSIMVPQSSVGEAMPEGLKKTRKIADSRSNYTVGKNDTAWSISKKYKVSVKTLVEANGLPNSKAIRPGMKLSIPDASDQATKKTRVQAAKAREQVTRYTVRQGDTVYSLSKKFGVTAEALKGWNKIKGTELRAGESLKVYAQ
ncbi:MAG: LysM peptidoglycan-binding domain-containing protein [Desulfovibrio sp.]|jgi:membrane-bound lytic murein transglycosylase D|nr:LysM peptidoglycan-binding domain-containing protein [Desulfovibrio sp.]